MFRRMLVFALFGLAGLGLSASVQVAGAAPPSDSEPLGYTQTLVNAAPDFAIYRVTHTTADMQPSVQCPSGYKVVGGGFKGSQYALVYHSFKKNNGWQIKAKPYSTVWPNLTVYATCLQWSHSVTYYSHSININSLQTDSTSAVCAAGEVAIGGGHKMNDARALIYVSVPNPNKWVARALNQAAITRKLTVLVICVPDIYTNQNIVSHSVNVPPGTTQSSNQVCPHPMFSVMSGGFDAEQIYWRISSFPKNDDNWRVTMRNDHTSSTIGFKVYANCFEFTE